MNLMFWKRRNDETSAGGEGAVLEQLSAYLDGELTDAEMASVEALIARDNEAAEVLEDLRLMRSAFGALGEVRAPRSFAIPADAAVAPRSSGSPLGLFRRGEMFMRASAAMAALFFVVALVNNPSAETPVADFAFDGAQTSMSAPVAENAAAPESLEAAEGGGEGTEGGDAGAAGLAAPAPAVGDEPPADDEGQPESMGALAAPSEDGDQPSGGAAAADAGTESAAGAAPDGDTARSATELQPLPAGTDLVEDSSQGVGGMVLGLGTVAGLLTAMSVLTAWARRSGDSTR